MLKLGDIVSYMPETMTEYDPRTKKYLPVQGTVVYIHPQGRYHRVEFELAGGKVRESFWGCK